MIYTLSRVFCASDIVATIFKTPSQVVYFNPQGTFEIPYTENGTFNF